MGSNVHKIEIVINIQQAYKYMHIKSIKSSSKPHVEVVVELYSWENE